MESSGRAKRKNPGYKMKKSVLGKDKNSFQKQCIFLPLQLTLSQRKEYAKTGECGEQDLS